MLASAYVMLPARRKTDRIREICLRMVDAEDDELLRLNAELQVALTEHSLRLENIATATVLGWPEFPVERRTQLLRLPPPISSDPQE